MPALPNASRVIKCIYSGTLGGAKWANVFHVQAANTGLTGPDATILATGLIAAYDARLKALTTTTTQLTGCTVVDLTSTSGQTAAVGAAVSGTVAATNALPANIALCASMKINRRYRGGHPRLYLTGQITSNTSNNTNWAGAWITGAGTAFTNWRSDVNALTTASSGIVTLVCLSYYADKVLRAIPQVDAIQSIVIHSRIDTQRRRLGKELA
jgi:hypothetical protein